MFAILEIHFDNEVLGIIKKENGQYLTFETKRKAQSYAKKNCAWEYQIVEVPYKHEEN